MYLRDKKLNVVIFTHPLPPSLKEITHSPGSVFTKVTEEGGREENMQLLPNYLICPQSCSRMRHESFMIHDTLNNINKIMKPFRNFYKGFIDIILQLIKQEKYHSKLYMQ